jgi:ubiquinone/menaquinone biosynthesis C-methylase UbiE
VLDLACGQGRHAHLLAEAGFDVDGLDYSDVLLRRARARGTGVTLRYTKGDMRRLPARWTARFDAVVNLFTSFGFFLHPADDARVIGEVSRVLAPNGIFVWQGASRDGVAAGLVDRDWWTIDGGTVVTHERAFDPLAGTLSVTSTWHTRGRARRHAHRIRLYTATRLAELCQQAGLVVEQAYEGWSDRSLRRTSGEMLLVARKAGNPA